MTTHAEWCEWRVRAVGVFRLVRKVFHQIPAMNEIGDCVAAIDDVIALAPPAEQTRP